MSGSEPERLQKVLAHAGLGSRRAVEDLIRAGRIKVNGQRAELGRRIDPEKDAVEVDGTLYPLKADLAYYLLNKPEGVVSTSDDPEGRTTVIDLVDVPTRVWPVGRLDRDTEGAILLTNDGELTQRISHPRYGFPKTYLAEMQGVVGKPVVHRLAKGVELEDGFTAPAQVKVLGRSPGSTLVELTIKEGRNRQVRRMGEAVGHPVLRLVRSSLGPLSLGRLKPGSFRKLGTAEIRELYRAVDL